jgi:chaperonin GroEL
MPRRSVVFQPTTYRGIQRGVNQLVNAVRPTLGPRPRLVAIDNVDYHDKTPRLFDDGATIARHIIRLQDPNEDMGAMLVRDLLWRLQQQVGDGTATAAVIFAKVYNEGVRYLTAGGNAMQLKFYLERGMRIILDELTAMTQRVEGKKELAQMAESLCYDPDLAK